MAFTRKALSPEQIQASCIQKFWHLVCHRSSLPSHGSFFRFRLGRVDLFIHNSFGKLSCYLNKCPHRGARIVNALSGDTPLQCPYHGWSFQPGKTSVPRYDTFDLDVNDPRQARLHQWQIYEVAGFVFVACDPASNVQGQIGDDAFYRLQSCGASIHACHSSQSIDYAAPWMLAVENALESYHVPSVHPSTLGLIGLEDGTNTFSDWSSSWQAATTSKKLISSSRIIAKSINIEERLEGYFSLYLFPFAMLSSTESLSFALQVYQPSPCLQDCNTTLRTSLYIPRIVNSAMRDPVMAFYDSSANMNRLIFEEDASISSLVPFESWDAEPLPYASSLESKINHFRECCRRSISV
jgi:phenylpropionate dioxygenase-like ring-hydroxylating dioxygenase large terminal subunit